MQIETTKTSTPQRFLQLSISAFATPKPKDDSPFVAVDIVRNPMPKLTKKRGRPPKKAPISQPRMDIEEYKFDESEDEKKAQIRGSYKMTTFLKKLRLLEDYVKFKKDGCKDVNGETISFNEFYRRKSAELANSPETVKRWCLDYEKDNSLLVKLQTHCTGTKRAQETGHVNRRDHRLTYSKDIDMDLFDWYSCLTDMGVGLSRDDIKIKARSMIQDENPNFKGTDGWLDAFLRRYSLSLRKPNSKAPCQDEEYAELASKFCHAMREIIKKHKIEAKYIINLDETPLFWEYLPRKIVCSKFSSKCSAWKRGYDHSRSTVALAVTGNGKALRPTLILKRTTPYHLQVDNDIALLTLHNKKGWMEETLMLEWIDRVLLPYVKNAHALLLMDSFEAHMSSKVLSHLAKFPNIHVGIIVGGTTSYCQPLDITVNKEFKSVCRKKSLEYSNRIVQSLHEIQSVQKSQGNNKLMIVQDQVVIAQKDLGRKKKKAKKLDQAVLMKKMTPEDIYPWIQAAHRHIQNNPDLIIKGFRKAGYFDGEVDALEPVQEHEDLLEELIPLSESEGEDNSMDQEEDQHSSSESLKQESSDDADDDDISYCSSTTEYDDHLGLNCDTRMDQE